MHLHCKRCHSHYRAMGFVDLTVHTERVWHSFLVCPLETIIDVLNLCSQISTPIWRGRRSGMVDIVATRGSVLWLSAIFLTYGIVNTRMHFNDNCIIPAMKIFVRCQAPLLCLRYKDLSWGFRTKIALLWSIASNLYPLWMLRPKFSISTATPPDYMRNSGFLARCEGWFWLILR